VKPLKVLLFPLSLLYGFILYIRNKCYDAGIFKAYKPKNKSIVVGNLSVGGTGKTPHIDYLANYFHGIGKEVNIVSRGYGRKTKDRIEVSIDHKSSEVGDEPLQLKMNNPDAFVFVDANRVNSTQIIEQRSDGVILYDDAFQHRSINAGFNILLTEYSRPFYKDHVLPFGRLREWSSGADRADLIIVTKCPELSGTEKDGVKGLLKRHNKEVIFSKLQYGQILNLQNEALAFENNMSVLLIAGIANPSLFIDHVQKSFDIFKKLIFRDHHNFNGYDIRKIREIFSSFANENKIILTTEKDATRLKELSGEISDLPIYYIPIKITFSEDDENRLKEMLEDYVRDN
jgi:tetraacyldisaccharide 4'-kinase